MNALLTHVPVLSEEVLTLLQPQEGESVLDCTVGLGGHALLLLEKVGPQGLLTGLDADRENLSLAEGNLSGYSNIRLLHANFRDLSTLNLPPVDVLFADLGLSSPHVDSPDRGFSFRFDAPLDLRFDRSSGETVCEFIHSIDEGELTSVLRTYGEVRFAKKLAHAIILRKPRTTFDLRGTVEEAFGFRAKQVLPQVFQALRIAINDELTALKLLLDQGPTMLKPGGRIGIISYHSLEDRLVKHTFRSLTTPLRDPLTGRVSEEAPFTLLTKKPVKPSAREVEENPRARSALLRVIMYTP